MKNLLPIAVSSLLAGGAIGYVIGNGSSETPEPNQGKVVTTSGGGERTRTIGGGGASADGSGSRTGSSYSEIMQEPGQTARLQALLLRYSKLSAEELAEEANALDSLPFNERILPAILLFGAWAEVSPYDAIEHSSTKMGGRAGMMLGMMVRPTVLQSWASTDPKGAAAYFENNKSQFAMMGMMGGRGGGGGSAATIASEWAKQDPESALTWANTLEGKEKSDATVKALSQLAVTDPSRAAELTKGLEGDALSGANSSIAGEWAKSDWGKAEAWVSGLPADQQEAAMGSAIESLASDNPALAATKALAMNEGDSRDNAIEEVSKAMAKDDPKKAVDFVMENGSEDAQRKAVGEAMGNWVGQDPAGARTWIDDQPEGKVRDAGVSSYVMNNSNTGPEMFALAETIGDERTRGWTAGVAAGRMAATDKEGAVSSVEASQSLDDGTKERILGRINGGGGDRRPGR